MKSIVWLQIAVIVGLWSFTPAASPKSKPNVADRGQTANVEILTNTMGVNFGPYVNDAIKRVRKNWYHLIPQIARRPRLASGRVAIEFAILPEGKVRGMRVVMSSGEDALDRAAWRSITASNPFKPLPKEFKGPYLGLRFNYVYNP